MRDLIDQDRLRRALNTFGWGPRTGAVAFHPVTDARGWRLGNGVVVTPWVERDVPADPHQALLDIEAEIRRDELALTRDKVIAHLRSLSAEGLLELLREARVCVGWEDCDDDGAQTDDEIGLSQLHTACSRAVAFCRRDPRTPGWWWRLSTPDGSPGPHGLVADLPSAQRAAEDAAIAAGYRVPWRDRA